jgi:signal transduction histidine kinase
MELPYPVPETRRPVHVLAAPEGLVVLVGAAVNSAAAAELESLLPLWLHSLGLRHSVTVAEANAAAARALVVDAHSGQAALDRALRSLQQTMREAESRRGRIELLRFVTDRLLRADDTREALPDVADAVGANFGVELRLQHVASDSLTAPAPPAAEEALVALSLSSDAHPGLGELQVLMDSSRRLDSEEHAVLRDIAEQYAIAFSRNVLHKQLAERADQLADAMRLREEFLSVAAHELRNPIHIISGFAGVLSKAIAASPTPDRELVGEALGHITQSATQMRSVVDGFLDISRMERGALVLDHCLNDLAQLISTSVLQVESGPFFNGQPISVDVPANIHFIGDENRLAEVFVNLIGNAVKYSAAGTEVAISAEDRDDWIIVTVTDRGIGISDEEQRVIFDAFVRGRDASRYAPGTGVGLFITRAIVTAHGGQVTVDSKRGFGTTVRVVLPRIPSGFEIPAE